LKVSRIIAWKIGIQVLQIKHAIVNFNLNVLFNFQVRLMGCQDLAEEVPGRTRREHPASPDLRSFVKGVTGRSSSKSYSVKDETSSK
jgi:hypothetical protein